MRRIEAMRQLRVHWNNDPLFALPSLVATYKGRELRMTWEGGLYIGWIDGVRKVSAESKGELYRKYMDELR